MGLSKYFVNEKGDLSFILEGVKSYTLCKITGFINRSTFELYHVKTSIK